MGEVNVSSFLAVASCTDPQDTYAASPRAPLGGPPSSMAVLARPPAHSRPCRRAEPGRHRRMSGRSSPSTSPGVIPDIADRLAYTCLDLTLLASTHQYAVCCYAVRAKEQETRPKYYRYQKGVTSDVFVFSSSGWAWG